ncbi:Cell division control protein 7, partial [Leucoagaricus sp. SymC.cos]
LYRKTESIANHERKQILSIVRMVAKFTQIFPLNLELKGVECNLSDPYAYGGFADIIKGNYKGHPVCVKAVRIYSACDNTSNLQAEAKEFALWAHLSHLNILPFYGVYVSEHPKNPRICIVSQWMQNGDLRSYLRSFPNSPKILLVLFQLFDVISGLHYLHENCIIHADLKAANVLVTESGRAVLGDFGLSRVVSGFSTPIPIVKGTHNWTAPELILDEESVPSEKSDIWSFGCVCYEV